MIVAMSQKISFPDWVSAAERGGQSKADIANGLGIELASLYRYLSRDRVPNKAVMTKIDALSKGAVDLAWFFSANEQVRA